MTQALRDDFTKIADLVKAADIPEEKSRTLLWCLGQLPALYEQLSQTYEVRYSDKIVALERGIVGELAKEAKQHPDAERLAAVIADSLRDLHERHGLASLTTKAPKAKVPPRKPRGRALREGPK